VSTKTFGTSSSHQRLAEHPGAEVRDHEADLQERVRGRDHGQGSANAGSCGRGRPEQVAQFHDQSSAVDEDHGAVRGERLEERPRLASLIRSQASPGRRARRGSSSLRAARGSSRGLRHLRIDDGEGGESLRFEKRGGLARP
jgi:hypothetical protein